MDCKKRGQMEGSVEGFNQLPSAFYPIITGTTGGNEFEGDAVQLPIEKNRKTGIGLLGLWLELSGCSSQLGNRVSGF